MTLTLRSSLIITIILITTECFAQTDGKTIIADNEAFRIKLNKEYADSTESPLPNDERLVFDGLPFFPIDTNFCVTAQFYRAKRSKPFEMKTTTDRKPIYEVYGTVVFQLNGKEYSLNVYQSHQLRAMDEFKEDLFLPFTDLSNGEESYGGGRFIDLKIPSGNSIVIDFNQAYNPYCAYSNRYSCPIPPKENFLKTEVLAGVKNPH
ncbi:MAG: DUF1684 domain-containing protein [Flavobacteriales bacterium]|nr:DUF1684 domain-containing protein [Flavobacteriales bacterium]